MVGLKSRFLAAVGYVCAEGESAEMAWSRLRATNPDMFPVPRAYESMFDACAEVVRNHEGAK